MKGTSSFVIGRYKGSRRHYELVLESKGGTRRWIIPKNIPRKYREKRIAIEETEGKNSGERWDGGRREIWDRGAFETEASNSIRMVINASGEKLRGRYLLLVPGWGRWTGKRLWVLEKIRGE